MPKERKVRVSVQVPPDAAEKMQQIADQYAVSTPTVYRWAVTAYLKDKPPSISVSWVPGLGPDAAK